MVYEPPGGAIGAMIAKMFQREPNIQRVATLKRFKQLLRPVKSRRRSPAPRPPTTIPEERAMRALTWQGKKDVRVAAVDDPEIVNPRDAIIKITSTAICGSDLHLYDGVIPSMKAGDVLGHEFMGEVVETGKGVTGLQKGQRVVVPFVIACGSCYHCSKLQYSSCDTPIRPTRRTSRKRCSVTRRAGCSAIPT